MSRVIRFLLGNVEVIVGRPLGAVDGCRGMGRQIMVVHGGVARSKGVRTLPVVTVGAVLATITVLAIAVVLDIALTLAGEKSASGTRLGTKGMGPPTARGCESGHEYRGGHAHNHGRGRGHDDHPSWESNLWCCAWG